MKLVIKFSVVYIFIYFLEIFISISNSKNNRPSKKIYFKIYNNKKKIISRSKTLKTPDMKVEDIFLKNKKNIIKVKNNPVNSKNKDFNHINTNEFYSEFLNKSKPMSEKIEYSKPFSNILEKVLKYFPKEKTKEMAELEIEKLRKFTTEKAANYFVNLKINSTQDYWYSYYVLSKVALKGRKNQTNQLPEEWELPDPKEFDSEFKNDDFYQKLKAKNDFYQNKIDICKKKTLGHIKLEIINSSLTGSNLNKILSKKELIQLAQYITWYGNIRNESHLHFSDFQIQDRLNFFVRRKSFFYKQIESQFPKGIIHHIHLGACFDNLLEALKKTFVNSSTNQKSMLNVEFIYVRLFEEDKVKKGIFSDNPSAKILFVEDVKKLIDSSTPELEKVFKENFILPNGNCTVTTEKTRNLPINENFKAYFYFRFCQGFLFSKNFQELRKIAKEKRLFKREVDYRMRIDVLTKLNTYTNKIGKIYEMYEFWSMSKSKMELSFSTEDYLSNAIWEKFESIFGMYENLFDNPFLMKELLKILAETFKNQKIYGVEFRQKNDKSKANSKYVGIKEAFAKENILTAFILPGRKVVNGNGLKANIEEINKNTEEDVSGIDFVGYEDDPFSGARNFFSSTILNDNNLNNDEKNKNKNASVYPIANEFDLLFNSLRKGNKFYPHAGETLYIPDYPIDEKFMDKFYINDNLIHSALLPNVERLGHGFAVINNGLLAAILKKKSVGLEICPISNQLLFYHKIYENPGLKLLRHGMKVAISPDDPGFFGYMGVAMDWFQLIMQTDVKASEIYMLLKNSILKASPNIMKQKDILIPRLQNDLKAFFEGLNCKVTKEDAEYIDLSEFEIASREDIQSTKRFILGKHIEKNKVLLDVRRNNILLNMYSKILIIRKAKESMGFKKE